MNGVSATPSRGAGRTFLLAVFLLLAALRGPTRADTEGADPSVLPAAPLNERVLKLPGDPAQPVTLEVTLYTPNGPGPFPLAIMNHGASGASNNNRGARYRFTISAYYFLSRGYAVALPMMRGFAGSGGTLVHYGCDLAAVGTANARDIGAVIDAVSALPTIDGRRVIVAGQSFGGWNALAVGTLGRPAVKGVVNFVGGIRSSDCADPDTALVAAAATFGARTHIPSIWFYGDNDTLFPVATWRGMHARYTSAGGQAELVPVGAFKTDSHQFLSYTDALPIWTPRVDRFLASLSMPSAIVNPGYLPTPGPAPSHFAAITDAAAVPFLKDSGRALYQRFLAASDPKAFAIAANGTATMQTKGYDPLARAMAICTTAPAPCGLYAVNDAVVWTSPKAAPRLFNITVAAGTTSLLTFAYAVNPDCSSRGLPKLWIVQPPAHGSAEAARQLDFPRFQPNNPLAACNTGKVPGIAVRYTPAKGFTGSDLVTFEEINTDNQDLVYRLSITVH